MLKYKSGRGLNLNWKFSALTKIPLYADLKAIKFLKSKEY